MLFDLRTDYGEQHDIAAQNPKIVAEMSAAYEKWWPSVVPMMVNENVPLAPVNPFWALYIKQFGSLPPQASVGPQKLLSHEPAGGS
jgi:arylsulfatase